MKRSIRRSSSVSSTFPALVLLLFLLVAAYPSFGRGTPEDSWRVVDDAENWQHEIDIAEQSPGVYNVVVRGTDIAGNVVTAGPVNIRIDPESDKPIARVIYPENDRIVRGDIHVVGVAIDDDAVSRVELRLNDGPWRRADGTEYWRSRIAADTLPDGPHTLTVRAVDINGLIGDEFTSRFILDTKPPRITVTSHESGAVVNGRVRFDGMVSDANGITDLRLSRDDRATFERLRYRYDRNEQTYSFRFDVRTDRIDDGPVVYWLSATDGAENVSLQPFLFFVDNQPPDILVIDPVPESPVAGRIRITGSVRDLVGIDVFQYEWNGEQYPIELIPGNPYWSIEIDTSEHRGRWVDVRFTAIDTSGNQTTVRHRLANAQDAARPTVVIESPDAETVGVLPPDAVLYGYVTGANTPVAVRVTGIGGEQREFPANPGFRIPLVDAPAGRLDLRISARDDRGLIGPEVRFRAVKQALAPVVSVNRIVYADDESLEYVAGILYDTTRTATVTGRIETNASLQSVTVHLGRGDGVQTPRVSSRRSEPGFYDFSFPIDRFAGFGVVPFVVTVVDEYEATVAAKNFVYARDLRRIEREPGLLLVDERRSVDGVIRIGADQKPVNGLIIGVSGGAPSETFHDVELVPPNDVVALRHDGSIFRIVPMTDGRIDDVYIRAKTESGFQLDNGPFTILVDTTAPEITIESPSAPDHTGSTMVISGRIFDAGGIESAEYSLDGELTFTELPLGGTGEQRTFSATVDLGDTPSPSYAVVVRAADSLGNTTRAVTIVNRLADEPAPPTTGDGAAQRQNDTPVVELVYPRANAVFVGSVPIAGIVRDLDGTRELQLSIDGGEFETVVTFDSRRHHQTFLFETPPLAIGVRTVRIRAVDRLGVTSREAVVRVNVASPASVITLGPEDSELAPGFRVALGDRTDIPGAIANAERIQSARYRINESVWTSLSTRPSGEKPGLQIFSARIPGTLEFGEHRIEVEAIDREGNTARRISAFFVGAPQAAPAYEPSIDFYDNRVSDDEIAFATPEPVSGRFVGPAVASAEITGADGLIRLSHAGNRVTLEPLTHGIAESVTVIVTGFDGSVYESRPRRVIVDFEKPVLDVGLPVDGSYSATRFVLSGSARDTVELRELSYRLGFDGRFTPITVDESGSFEIEITNPGVVRGVRHLFVRAVDSSGHVSETSRSVFFDPDPPVVHFITPVADETINGLTRVVASLSSASPIVSAEYSLDGESFTPLDSTDVLDFLVDFSVLEIDEQALGLRATDSAGNTVTVTPRVTVDLESDFPVVEIQIPEPGAVVTSDFSVTGIALDDDGIGAVYWRVGTGEFSRLPARTSFSIEIPLADLADNEQTIELYAEDLYGLRGESSQVSVNVSTAAPTITIAEPEVDRTHRGTVVLSGRASDGNGVERIRLSFDNGVSFQNATVLSEEIEAQWRYELDSTVMLDGTYSVQVVAEDSFGIENRLFTLVNIDNTSPVLELTSPADGQTVSGSMAVNGRFLDNLEIVSAMIQIEPIDHDAETIVSALSLETVLADQIDLQPLTDGWYNVRVSVVDGAGNETMVSRNVYVRDEIEGSTVSILFPVEGESVAGPIVVSGRVVSTVPVRRVTVFVDGDPFGVAELDGRGFFHLPVDTIGDGRRVATAVIEPAGGERVASDPRSFAYASSAAFVAVTSHRPGEYVAERPWIEGVAGYPVQDGDSDDRAAARARRVERVLVSLDNGRTFSPARGAENWRYRIETGDVTDGPLSFLAVAEFADGTSASARSLFTVDTTPPRMELVTPEENARVNTTLTMSGVASDANGMSMVEIALRPGDKAGYAVPSFIQGMYVDTHFLGLTYFQIGLGLTFFDQNVKLQANFGVSPQTTSDGGPARFAGNFFGGKILANVASVPFSVFFGPDWEFLSLNLAIGASFNYIALYEPFTPFGGDPVNGVVLSAIIAQLEFPRIAVADWSAFNAYSFYVEPQVWFVPSDIRPDIEIRLTFGARVQLF